MSLLGFMAWEAWGLGSKSLQALFHTGLVSSPSQGCGAEGVPWRPPVESFPCPTLPGKGTEPAETKISAVSDGRTFPSIALFGF